MGIADRAGLLAFLKAHAPDDNIDIAGQRARMDAPAVFFPTPDGAVAEPAGSGSYPKAHIA